MSEPEIVNPVGLDESEAWVRNLVTTLLGNVHDDDFPRRVQRWTGDWLPERTWAVRHQGRLVATLATEPRTLTVPGAPIRDLAVDALTGVTVAATHRRRGLLTKMISQSLQAAKDRGDAASILIAAEWPIYGRYGYAPAVVNAQYRYHPKRPNAALPPPPPGSVRQVEPEELGAIARAVFEAARRLRPGQVDRRDPWWDRRLAQNGYEPISTGHLNWIVHEGPDGPDGLLGWKVARDFELNGELGGLEVSDFAAATDEAYRDLWGYLSGIDVIDSIEFHDRPVDEPIRWLLTDGRALQQVEAGDFLWLRLLDVPAALSARGYATDGRVVLDIDDHDLGGYGTGRVVLAVTDGQGECRPTDEPADVRITQRTLASIYLGGHRLQALTPAGGVEELTPGAAALVDVMFSTPLAPWNQTGF